MEKEILKHTSGVFSGFSTDRAFPDEWVEFYDGDKLIARATLNRLYPESKTSYGFVPGYEAFIFFRHSLIVKYPRAATHNIFPMFT